MNSLAAELGRWAANATPKRRHGNSIRVKRSTALRFLSHGTYIALLIVAIGGGAPVSAQATRPLRDQNDALLVTSDIAHFWRAYDRATSAPDAETRARAYLDLYIRPGSRGLRDWVRSRLASGQGLLELLVTKGWSRDRLERASTTPLTDAERARLTRDTSGMGDMLAAMNLDAAVQHRPRFFAAIRGNTLAIDTARAVKDSIRAYYSRLVALYPEAVFPPVYFLIGQLSSGGTTSDAGQLIGAELHGADTSTPLGELSDYERRVIGRVDGLPGIVAHEVMHIQQARARRGANAVESQSKPSLLAQSLDEGCASFLAAIVTRVDPAATASQYGLAHEHDLWVEFQRDMMGTDASKWLYQGDRSKDRPADLGYFMGARICASYYLNAKDKRQAVRDIFAMSSPSAFLARSGYAP
jgi:hypothetical protein